MSEILELLVEINNNLDVLIRLMYLNMMKNTYRGDDKFKELRETLLTIRLGDRASEERGQAYPGPVRVHKFSKIGRAHV